MKKHYTCITDPKEVGQLIRDTNGFEGLYVVQTVLELIVFIFLSLPLLRGGEIQSGLGLT